MTIPAGRKVLLLYGAANRDPRRYGPDADELDVRRNPGQILTFSQGNHFCLGANAARMQARVALEELLDRCPGVHRRPRRHRVGAGCLRTTTHHRPVPR